MMSHQLRRYVHLVLRDAEVTVNVTLGERIAQLPEDEESSLDVTRSLEVDHQWADHEDYCGLASS
jgi:hypothetical protein